MRNFTPLRYITLLLLLGVFFSSSVSSLNAGECWHYTNGTFCLNGTTSSLIMEGAYLDWSYLLNTPAGFTDTNNYTTSISFGGNTLTLARLGMTDLTATLPYNGLKLDAEYNLTNKAGLVNSHTLACQNITGADSDLCTITQGGDGTVTNVIGSYGINVTLGTTTPTLSINRTLLDTVYYLSSNPNGYITAYINNYTVNCSVTGTNTKTASCQRNDNVIYQFSWTDLDTNDTSSISALQAFQSNIYTNVTVLQAFQTNIYNNVSILQLFQSNIYTNVSNLQTFQTNIYNNVTSLQTYMDNNYINVSSLQLFRDNIYINLTLKTNQADFVTQNTSIWTSISNLISANSSIWITLNNLISSNTSTNIRIDTINSSLDGKQPSFANSSGQCSGTDKVINVTSLNGIITTTCATDNGGAGGSDGTGGWTNTTTYTTTVLNVNATGNVSLGTGNPVLTTFANGVNLSSLIINDVLGCTEALQTHANGSVYCGTDATGSVSAGSINNESLNLTNTGSLGQVLSLGTNSQFTWITPTAGSGDGTGGWINTTTYSQIYLALNISGNITSSANQIKVSHRDMGQLWIDTTTTDGNSILRLTETNTYTGGFIEYNSTSNVFRLGTHTVGDTDATNDLPAITIGRSNSLVTIQKNLTVNDKLTTGNLTVSNLTATNCNVRADINGVLYCDPQFNRIQQGVTTKLTVATITTSQQLALFNLTANKIYNIYCNLLASSAAATTGTRINSTCSVTPTAFNLTVQGFTSATAASIGTVGGCASAAGATTTGTTANGVTSPVIVIARVDVGAANLLLNLTFGGEVAATTHIETGSMCEAIQLN